MTAFNNFKNICYYIISNFLINGNYTHGPTKQSEREIVLPT